MTAWKATRHARGKESNASRKKEWWRWDGGTFDGGRLHKRGKLERRGTREAVRRVVHQQARKWGEAPRRLMCAAVATCALWTVPMDLAPPSDASMDTEMMDQMLDVVLRQRENLYTPDATQALQYLKEYEKIVEKNETVEETCEDCEDHRRFVERAWQVVSNEFFSPRAEFKQSEWARLLVEVIRSKQVIKSRAEAYATVSSMVESLGDGYSQFLPPAEYRRVTRRSRPEERSYLSAMLVGVGIEVGSRNNEGYLQVVAPLASSPAEEAGIQPGDLLLSVDDFPTTALSKDEVLAVLRGPSGSIIKADVRDVQGITRTVELERRRLPQPPLDLHFLDAERGREIAYIRLRYFSSSASKELEKALKESEYRGVDALVVDLRNNPGGTFEEAIADAALFLENKYSIVSTVRNYADNEPLRKNPHAISNLSVSRRLNVKDNEYYVGAQKISNLTQVPIALILNKGSASGSEVLAGALHDHHRAKIIGEKSFGKGVIQYFFPLGDGSGLKLTVAKYVTPAGHDISLEGGLEPDFSCKDYPHKLPEEKFIRLDRTESRPKNKPILDKCVLLASTLAR